MALIQYVTPVTNLLRQSLALVVTTKKQQQQSIHKQKT